MHALTSEPLERGHSLILAVSSGMGKSTVSRMFVSQGIPVWDADKVIHRHTHLLFDVNGTRQLSRNSIFAPQAV